MKTYTALVAMLLLCLQLSAQELPTFKGTVSENYEINPEEDTVFGVGDDGIYNIMEPTVKASSALDIKFDAQKAHDFNLLTPWVEGKEGHGIGEFLEYTFDLKKAYGKGRALSINEFWIINGYRKNKAVWKANSRVKKLKMYINNKPIAYISLRDTYRLQFFVVPERWLNYGTLTTIRFEIMEVYPGDKYEDTAIGEIQFSGSYAENMN